MQSWRKYVNLNLYQNHPEMIVDLYLPFFAKRSATELISLSIWMRSISCNWADQGSKSCKLMGLPCLWFKKFWISWDESVNTVRSDWECAFCRNSLIRNLYASYSDSKAFLLVLGPENTNTTESVLLIINPPIPDKVNPVSVDLHEPSINPNKSEEVNQYSSSLFLLLCLWRMKDWEGHKFQIFSWPLETNPAALLHE